MKPLLPIQFGKSLFKLPRLNTRTIRALHAPIVISGFLFFSVFQGHAQCNIIANAVPTVSLGFVQAGGTNSSGVAYNPNQNVYYAAIAGNSGFPLETFDAAGTPIYQTNTGFDMRGLWWNFNLNQLESNGYNTLGVWTYNLNGAGHALNTGTSVFTGLNQPTSQSVGDYNCVDNEIWYYNNGSIQKRDRATNALLSTLALTGMPVGTGNLNNNSVFYTDCAGHEIGLVDYQLKRVYFFDKTSGAYAGMSQLPAATVVNNSFRASWANGQAFLYDVGTRTWYGFNVLTGFNTACSVVPCTPPLLITDDLNACQPNTVDLNNGINAGSGVGNAQFYASLADANTSSNPIANIVLVSGTYYVGYEDPMDPSCFSVDSIIVTIDPIYNINENVNACENSTVTYPDGSTAVITASTSYTSNLTTGAGCDSIIVTNVTMDPVYNVTDNINACENSTVTYPDGSTAVITASTSYTSNLTAVTGCDSIVVTNVTMDPVYNVTDNINACENSTVTYPDGSTAVITASTAYTSNLTSAAGCDSIITTNVTMDPIYNSTENINACENSTVTYPDGSTAVITASTSYTSNMTSAAGCDSIIVTNVTMDMLPNAGTNGTITFCDSDPTSDLFAVLGGAPDPGGTWTPAMASGTGVFNPAVDAGGTYTYEINSACGMVSAQVDVTVNPTDDPSFNYSGASFCSTDPNPVATISGTTGGQFTISGGGSIDPTTGEINLTASGAGSYDVTYTTNGLCPSSSTVTIAIGDPADASFTVAGPYCTYDTPVQLVANTPGGTWSGAGVDPVTGVFTPSAAGIGTNTISYTIAGACGDSQSNTIDVFAPPTVSTIADTTIDLGASVDLTTVSSGTSFSWTPDQWIDCNDCQSPIATPQNVITYVVTATENGCTATDEVTITVDYDNVIFVPNIFSPNGDGNNDVLYVRGAGVSELQFVVYDRWGEKVFESTSVDDGWDGTFRGKPMNPAVFMYYVYAKYYDGTEASLKGDVTLIR